MIQFSSAWGRGRVIIKTGHPVWIMEWNVERGVIDCETYLDCAEGWWRIWAA